MAVEYKNTQRLELIGITKKSRLVSGQLSTGSSTSDHITWMDNLLEKILRICDENGDYDLDDQSISPRYRRGRVILVHYSPVEEKEFQLKDHTISYKEFLQLGKKEVLEVDLRLIYRPTNEKRSVFV